MPFYSQYDARIPGGLQTAEKFIFDLACKVISTEVNEIELWGSSSAGLLDAVRIMKISPVVSEIAVAEMPAYGGRYGAESSTGHGFITGCLLENDIKC